MFSAIAMTTNLLFRMFILNVKNKQKV